MRISEITNETKTITVLYKTKAGEYPIEVEYRTQVVTLGFLREMRERQGTDGIVYQIEQVVSNWDLQDDNDKVIPATAEAIEKAQIPFFLLVSILDAIAHDQQSLTDEAKNV